MATRTPGGAKLIGLAAVWAGVMVSPRLGAGQPVLVRVVDSSSGRPIAGALVTQRYAGAPPGRRLTNDRGVAHLTMISGGAYVVRVDAIGYRGDSAMIDGVTVGLRQLEFALTPAPLRLPDVDVMSIGPADCPRRGDEDEVAALWEELRKAFWGVTLSNQRPVPKFEMVTFDHVLDVRSRLRRADTQVSRMSTYRPFTSLSPQALHRDGYLQRNGDESWYAGPDAYLMLSDEFVLDHCLGLVRGPGGSLGVAFEPSPTRKVAEIGGTLWVDGARRLRRIDFTIRNLRFPAGVPPPEGFISYAEDEPGYWIIDSWRLRMPRVSRINKVVDAGVPWLGRVISVADSVVGFRETGGYSRRLR